MMEKAMKEIRLSEVRASDSNSEEMIVEGYAVVFNQPTDLGWCKEIIDRNALEECNMVDCVLRYNHNDNLFSVARTRNGSLEFKEDDYGLKIKAKLANTTQGRDLYTMIKDGYVDKMSFAFTVKESKWDYETDVRTITKIDKMYDVSIVDLPAYEGTSIFARSKEDYEEEKEKYLKNKAERKKIELKLKILSF